MKKNISLSLLLVLLLKLPIFSQTIYWEEDFSSNNADWTVQSNWEVVSGELRFSWSPTIENFDLFALSPLITLHDASDKIIVNQYLDTYSGTDELAEISVLSGSEETVLWSYAISGGNWGSETGQDIELSISDYAGQEVQFKFRTFGASTFNWNYWNIYQLSLSANLTNDLSIAGITGPNAVELLENNTWSVEVANLGTQAMSEFTVKLFDYTTGNLIGSQYITEAIPPTSTHIYDFEWSSNVAYNTAFYAVVEAANDEFESNNISKSYFVRIKPDLDFEILVWDNDNGINTVISPEKGDEIKPSVALTRVLDAAGFQYTLVTSLPNNLNEYEIVFSTMGCFCVS